MPLEAFTRSDRTVLASESTAQQSSITWATLAEPLKANERFVQNRNSDGSRWLFEVPPALDGAAKGAAWDATEEARYTTVGRAATSASSVQTGFALPTSDTPGNLFIYNDPAQQQSRVFVKFNEDLPAVPDQWAGLLMPVDFEGLGPLISTGADLPGGDTPGLLYAYNPVDTTQARLFVKFGDRWEGQPKAGDA